MPNLSQRAKAGTKRTANAGADARRKKTRKKRDKRSTAAVSDAAAKAARGAGGDWDGRIFADSPRMLLHRVRLGLGTSIDLHTAVIAIVEMMRDRLIRLSGQTEVRDQRSEVRSNKPADF